MFTCTFDHDNNEVQMKESMHLQYALLVNPVWQEAHQKEREAKTPKHPHRGHITRETTVCKA